MKRYDIGAFAIYWPADGGRALQPLSSATETLDWLNGAVTETHSLRKSDVRPALHRAREHALRDGSN